MPDIINNVINGIYPASGHNIYVCELAPLNASGLYIQQLKSFGGFRIAKNTTGECSNCSLTSGRSPHPRQPRFLVAPLKTQGIISR